MNKKDNQQVPAPKWHRELPDKDLKCYSKQLWTCLWGVKTQENLSKEIENSKEKPKEFLKPR